MDLLYQPATRRRVVIMSKPIYLARIAGFNIELLKVDKRYTVIYGKQVLTGLLYDEAARELGRSIMHASCLEHYRVDPSNPDE